MATIEVETLSQGQLESALAQFTGSEQFYRHGLVSSIVYSEGAHFLAERAGAHWLLDEIALHNKFTAPVMAEEFQVWKLTAADNKGTLVCEDGNYNAVFIKEIEYTDFPLPEIKLFYANLTIYLPSEH